MAVRVRIGAPGAAPPAAGAGGAAAGGAPPTEFNEQHFVMRFPEDVAKRLREAQPPGVSIAEISESEYEVTVGNEKMFGRKFEFPTHMETFKLYNFSATPTAPAGANTSLNAGVKVADVHELLVVARDRKSLDAISDTLITVDGISMLPSGLTPPMQHVVERRFRKAAISDHQKNSVRSAESAIMSIVGGGHLEWEELQEVDALPDFSKVGALEENASVWEPTSSVFEELRNSGLMDSQGNLAPLSESDDDEDENLSVGGSSKAPPPSRRTGAGVGIRIGSR